MGRHVRKLSNYFIAFFIAPLQSSKELEKPGLDPKESC
jgi:hypothetical protein